MYNPVISKIKGVENKKNTTILRVNAENLYIKTTVETLGKKCHTEFEFRIIKPFFQFMILSR